MSKSETIARPAPRILDSHIHMPSEGWEGHRPYLETVDEAVAFLKSSGIAGAVFNTWQGVFAKTGRDLDEGNAAALELAEKHAGFLLPGACIHPAFPEASRRWLARFRDAGYRWVGELVPYALPYNYTDSAFLDLCAECEAHGHILQLHGDEKILDVAARFPGLRLVFSHLHPHLLPRIAGHPNLWQDFSGGAGVMLGNIEQAVEALGPDRILFGSDFTTHDPRCHLARLTSAVADAAVRENILAGNLERLLKLGEMDPFPAQPQ